MLCVVDFQPINDEECQVGTAEGGLSKERGESEGGHLCIGFLKFL